MSEVAAIVDRRYSNEPAEGKKSVELIPGNFITGLFVTTPEGDHQYVEVPQGASVIMTRMADPKEFYYSFWRDSGNGDGQAGSGRGVVTALTVNSVDDFVFIPKDVAFITAKGSHPGKTDWTGYHPKVNGNYLGVDGSHYEQNK